MTVNRVDLRGDRVDIDVWRGGRLPLTVTFTEDSVAIDVSSDTIAAKLRRDEDGAVVATMTQDTTDEATGVIVFDIADDDIQDLTGKYRYDVSRIPSGETRPFYGPWGTIDFGRNVTY